MPDDIDSSTTNNSLLKSFGKWLKSSFSSSPSSLEDTFAEIIEQHEAEGNIIVQEQQDMLANIFEFGTLEAEDVIVPRTDIVAVSYDADLTQLKEIFIKEGHTRMPVYKDTLDNILGFVHVKDILPFLDSHTISQIKSDESFKNEGEDAYGFVRDRDRASQKDEVSFKSEDWYKLEFKLESIIREILIVPPSMKLIDLLRKMRNMRTHIAVVVDEYGGTDGMVTIEDLMEQIVGEIKDEHDDQYQEPLMEKLDDKRYIVSGRFNIEELEKLINIEITEEKAEDYDTIGGLVCSLAGKVPEKGEKIEFNEDISFEILEADPRHLIKILIVRK